MSLNPPPLFACCRCDCLGSVSSQAAPSPTRGVVITARVLRLMAGLKATGWLPAASDPHLTLRQGCVCMHALRSVRPAAPALSAAAAGRPAAHAGWRAGREGRHSSTGPATTRTASEAVSPLRAAGSAAAQATRTAHAGREGSSRPAPDYSAGPRQQSLRPSPPTDRLSPADARAEAFANAVPEVFFLKGVSFGERQQNIEAIEKGACPVAPLCVLMLSTLGSRPGHSFVSTCRGQVFSQRAVVTTVTSYIADRAMLQTCM